MNKEAFIKYIKKVENLYKKYKHRFINKEYFMIFSNGEAINFRFYEKNFAHLVGIEIKKLRETGLIPSELKANLIVDFIVSDPENFYDLVVQNNFQIEEFISEFNHKKVAVLESINGFLPENFEFVSEFDPEKFFMISNDLKLNIDYLFGYKVKDEYGIIGIKKSVHGYYYPLTTLYYNEEKLKDLLKYQNLVLPLYTKVKTVEKKVITDFSLYVDTKVLKVKKYDVDYVKKYKCSINLSDEYITQMKHFDEKTNKLKKEIDKNKKEIFELQMSNIKITTENNKLKEELNKLKNQLIDRKSNEKNLNNQYLKLKKDIFNKEFIDDKIIELGFNALTNKEKNILEYYYGLNGKDKKTMSELSCIYEISSIQYTLSKIKKDFKIICKGLINKNPYIELLTDRKKLLSMAFTLSKEERDVFILKNGLFSCARANNKEISEELGIPYTKVKLLLESADEKIRDMVKR